MNIRKFLDIFLRKVWFIPYLNKNIVFEKYITKIFSEATVAGCFPSEQFCVS